jgi:hypothetical protein
VKFTIEVTTDLLAALQLMAREHECSDQTELERCVKFGITNLLYRMNRNKRVNAENKTMKQNYAKLAALLEAKGISLEDIE